MSITHRVQRTDLGIGRTLQELEKINNSYSKVGFPQGVNSEVTEQAKIASWLNFGTSKNPKAWPFMFNSLINALPELIQLRNRLYRRIVGGRLTTERALKLMGEFMTKKTQKEIVALRTPPNAPSTIRRKGSSNPLIDQGQMVQTVTHVEVIQ